MDGKTDEKYKRLKKNLKKALNENDQLKEDNDKLTTKIDHYKKRIRYLKHERDILIEKIQQIESDSESNSEISDKSSNSDNDSDGSKNKRNGHKVKDEQIEDTSSSKRRSRSKRKRGSSVRRAQHVDTDENGNAILPIRLGVMTLHKLGKVVYDRDSFHNERYIFPVGYTLTRRYFSMLKLDEYVNYRCVVKDGGNAPIFEVTPEDAVDKKTSASSPTGAWISIVKAVNEMRNKDHSNSASGPDYFGFTSSTIAKLIQDLPNAKKCKNYKWQKFETTSGKSLKKATEAARNELMKMESDRLRDEQLENNSMSININKNTNNNNDNTNKLVKPKEEGVDVDIEEDSQDNNQEEMEEVETETAHGEDEEIDEIEEDEDEEHENDDSNIKENKSSSQKKKKEKKKKDNEKREKKKESIDTNNTTDEDEDEIEDEIDSSDSDNNTKVSIANESQITTEDEN